MSTQWFTPEFKEKAVKQVTEVRSRSVSSSIRLLPSLGQEMRSDHNIVFGKLIRSLRQDRTWPQEELAWRANRSRQYISRLELGGNSSTMDTANALSHAFGMSLADFLNLFAQRLRGDQ